ncbi:MAG: hypothetical protein WC956_01055 [bacterium]
MNLGLAAVVGLAIWALGCFSQKREAQAPSQQAQDKPVENPTPAKSAVPCSELARPTPVGEAIIQPVENDSRCKDVSDPNCHDYYVRLPCKEEGSVMLDYEPFHRAGEKLQDICRSYFKEISMNEMETSPCKNGEYYTRIRIHCKK